MSVEPQVRAPIAMLAELTHRCPLACPYCSNPMELTRKERELDTATWLDVFGQAAALGVLHLHLSGGEPLSRRDLEALVAGAREAGLYTNLITSGIGLTERRLKALEAAGLDHVQLSLQGTDAETGDRIGGYRGGFARKMEAAGWIAAAGMPLTLNFVMHRQNVHQLEAAIALAGRLGARRIEVAMVQFHGWAMANRGALMPTREQAKAAGETVKAAAETIPGLVFETVRERPLAAIWEDGPAFAAFRGTEWMQEPCRSCERREVDFGGCRCQAMALAGDARATDPVCVKSPLHGELAALPEGFASGDDALVWRRFPAGREEAVVRSGAQPAI